MPGSLASAAAGLIASLFIALLSPRRRAGWFWTMAVGVIGGALSGLALFELGAGALGGATSLANEADDAALIAYASGGAVGGAALTVMFQVFRSIFFRPRLMSER